MSSAAEWEADCEMNRQEAADAEADALREAAADATSDNLGAAAERLSGAEWDAFVAGLWDGDDAAWLAVREPLIRALIAVAEPKFRQAQEASDGYSEALAEWIER